MCTFSLQLSVLTTAAFTQHKLMLDFMSMQMTQMKTFTTVSR